MNLDWLPSLLAGLVILVAVPLTWSESWLLWRLARGDRQGRALRLVAVLATCVALLVTVFALIFINNDMANPVLPLWGTQVLSRGSLLILSVVPAVLWLRWYRSNGH